MKIHEIMTRDPATVTPEATIREAAQIMLREEVGIVPVVEGAADNRLVGVITDRDIAIRCVAEGRDGSCKVRDAMSSGELTTCRTEPGVTSVDTRPDAAFVVERGRVAWVGPSGQAPAADQAHDVDSLMQAMLTEKVRRIPITDERGSLLGIVAQADVALKVHDPERAGRTVERISEPGGRHAR